MKISVTLIILILALCLPGRAHAYLDPASGSMILQVVLAAVASVVVILRKYWYKIADLFSSKKPDSEE